MTADARFTDAAENALRLRACDTDDLRVISMFVQDAVFHKMETNWDRRRREFAVLLSRFKWETGPRTETKTPGHERVRAVLRIADILSLTSEDCASEAAPDAFSILELAFDPSEGGAGRLAMILSGDREIAFDVECIEVSLTDVSSPYPAVSRNPPDHG